MFKMSRIQVAVLAALTLSSVALSGPIVRAAAQSSGVMQTSLPGGPATLSDQFFHVEWTSTPAPNGGATVTGYVYNDYGQPAQNVELKIAVVDSNGQPVESVIRPVRGLVPAEGRAYFQVQVPASPASYRVAVAGFEFLEFPGSK